MSQNTSQSFVTADEYVDHLVEAICACGHLVGDHVGAGCYSRQTTNPDPRGYCPCMKSPRDVMVAAADQLIRAKIAAELDRIALIHNDIANDDGTARMDATIHMGLCLELQKRAEEVRNG